MKKMDYNLSAAVNEDLIKRDFDLHQKGLELQNNMIYDLEYANQIIEVLIKKGVLIPDTKSQFDCWDPHNEEWTFSFKFFIWRDILLPNLVGIDYEEFNQIDKTFEVLRSIGKNLK